MNDTIENYSLIKYFLIIAIGLLFIIPLFTNSPIFNGTDFGAWGKDWSKISSCLESEGIPCNQISKFPAAYMMNSFLLHVFGKIGLDPNRSLLLINTVFIVLPVLFIIMVRGMEYAKYGVFLYGIAILATALPPYYINSGALEIQSGVVTGLSVSCILLAIYKQEGPNTLTFNMIMFLCALLFPLYKDTNLIVISGSLILSFILISVPYKRVQRKIIISFSPANYISIIAGLWFAILIIMGLNFIRYENILPVAYSNEALQTSPDLFKSVEFFVASILSPNGGVIIFWFASFFSTFYLMRQFGLIASNAAIIFSTILMLGSVSMFSLWWAPFGWDSWGNRLMIPAMLSSLICIISTGNSITTRKKLYGDYVYFQRIGLSLGFFKKKLFVFTICLLPLILSLHYTLLSYYADKNTLLSSSLFGGPACSEMMSKLNSNSGNMGLSFWRTDYYYDCARERFLYFPSLFYGNDRE